MPAVAGTFYPADGTILKNQVSKHFDNATLTSETNVAALIVPHAGYVFSGDVAASGYAKLKREAQYKNIFLIGPSHHKFFNGISIYPGGSFITPMGEVKINQETAEELMSWNHFISYDEEADVAEHCLEVQLPFLQYRLTNEFQIVPLIVGSDNPVLCKHLGEVLEQWFNEDNLFVISSDFSHYPPYESAAVFDAETANAVVSNKFDNLRDSCNPRKRAFPSNTQTALCGASGVQTLISLTEKNPDISFEKITYKNSGDSAYGGKKNVVGYWAIAANRK